MTQKECIAKLVQAAGIDGVLSLLADYCEDQAEEHESVAPASASAYDQAARLVRRAAAGAREILAR